MTMPARVTVLPATRSLYNSIPVHSTRKRRVAAYARVSTDSDEQYTSYTAQVSYYTDYIQRNPEWQFVDIYTDEGITGTSTKYREGFNRMIEDALNGQIDLIVTKSVSRFARNTVDTLTTVRKLKERGVEVFFEKENIYTLDNKGELLITIMSSLAQEESRSISENVTWGQRKRMADGKVTIPYAHFLGYRKGADGLPEIVPEEAETVKKIYRLFLEGKTPGGIAIILTDEQTLTPSGKTVWSPTTITSILKNERYKGDALLQKTFCVDFLTKKMKVNEGEVPQYYVENSHPAIVSKEVYDQVQQEFERRKSTGRRHRGTSFLAGKLVCECCGEFYGSKVWHSNSPNRRVIWRCNLKYKGAERCKTSHVTEEEVTTKFVQAVNKLLSKRAQIVADSQMIVSTLSDTSKLEKEKAATLEEIQQIAQTIEQLIRENASRAMNQVEYNEKYDGLVERYEQAQKAITQLDGKISRRIARRDELQRFIRALDQENLITEFSSTMWAALLDHITVCVDGSLRFTFRDNTEITI